MQNLLSLLVALLIGNTAVGQSDRDSVLMPLNDYMIGTSYNYPEQIVRAFHDSATLFLTGRDGNSLLFSPTKYANLFARRESGVFNGRQAKLISLDHYRDVAYAEIEILLPAQNSRYIDLMLLKKSEHGWQIIGKTATGYDIASDYSGPTREVIMEGFSQPWSMAFINDSEALVAELAGGLQKINLETKTRDQIGGLPDDLFTPFILDNSKYPLGTYPAPADGNEVRFNAGILEVLLDPNFSENQRVYLSYVSQHDQSFALKVIRATLQNNQLGNIETLLNPGPYVPGLFHFGGGMTFGDDGKLYVTAGERLFYENLHQGLPIAQDVSDARGKIYRINPDGSIPADNPDFGAHAIKGLYAIGIRAAQGITLHPQTGEIWFSEHGTIQGDEVNKLEAGANYGWPNKTSGKYRSSDYLPEFLPSETYTDPKHFWKQTVAPTGLTFYSGFANNAWNGNLIVPGLSGGSLWRLVLEGDQVRTVEELFVDDPIRLRKAVVSPNGELYLLTDEKNGRILRVNLAGLEK